MSDVHPGIERMGSEARLDALFFQVWPDGQHAQDYSIRVNQPDPADIHADRIPKTAVAVTIEPGTATGAFDQNRFFTAAIDNENNRVWIPQSVLLEMDVLPEYVEEWVRPLVRRGKLRWGVTDTLISKL